MTVNFYLKDPKSDGNFKKTEVSIYAKFTVTRRERFEIFLKEKILPKHWDFKTQRAKSSAPDHVLINLYLDDRRRKLITLYRENRDKTFVEFKNMALGIGEEKKTLSAAYESFLSQCAQDKDIKTLKKYEALRSHLFGSDKVEGFTKHHGEIDFLRLDWNFLDSFRKSLYGKGLQDSSVYKYIVNLKTFLAWAEERGYPVNTVYRKWKVLYRVKQVVTLTLHELEKLEEADLPHGPGIGRDFLCLEARTGQRIGDLLAFDIKDYSDYRWSFVQKKGHSLRTSKVSVDFVGYSAPGLHILAKHNFQLPKFSEQRINKWIKEACRLVGITQEITLEKWVGGKCIQTTIPKWKKMSTHIGRKTFITLTQYEFTATDVMRMTGIKSHQTLKHYEGEREDEHRRKGLISLQEKLKAG